MHTSGIPSIDKNRIDKVSIDKNSNNSNINNKNTEKDSCDDDFQEIIDFYNNNIGCITSYAAQIFQNYLEDMPKDLIIFAMEKAVEANVRTIKYIKAILNNWSKKGIKNKKEAELEDQNFKESKNKNETQEEMIDRRIKEMRNCDI